MNYTIPGPKAPPKQMQARAREERARRKACHGDWTPCETHERTPA